MKTLTQSYAIAALGITFIAGCGIPQFSAKRDFEKVIPINSQVDVNVRTFNGNISVTSSDQSEIQLIAHAKAYGVSQEEADASLEALAPEIDTTTSAISIECKKRTQAIMNPDSVSLELRVPATWPLKLVTSNGNVSTAQSQGPVTVDTSNGRIEVKGAAGTLHLTTSNGKIIVEKSTGNIQADSSNGTIQMTGCSLEGKCKLETSNGAISVSMSERTPIQLDASTSNGSIKLNEGDIDYTKKSKSHVAGVLFGKANGPASATSLDLQTSNGSITISKFTESTVGETTSSEPAATAN